MKSCKLRVLRHPCLLAVAGFLLLLLTLTLWLKLSRSVDYKTIHDMAWLNDHVKYWLLKHVTAPPPAGYNDKDYASDENTSWYRDIDFDGSGLPRRYVARRFGNIYTLYDYDSWKYVGVYYDTSKVPGIPTMYAGPQIGRGP